MSRLCSRCLLFPSIGVHMNISRELVVASRSLLSESRLRTATAAAASYSWRSAFGLVSKVNRHRSGSLPTWKCTVRWANVEMSDSAVKRKSIVLRLGIVYVIYILYIYL